MMGGDVDPPHPLAARSLPGGTVHLARETFEPSVRRGRFCLGDALEVCAADVATLCGLGGLESLDGALFLDTETTGLGGGAGTFVFLLGVASFTGGGFEVRQWVLPDPAEEEGLLDALAEEASRARVLVSFHGRGFDAPRLAERCALAGRASPLDDLPHLDLLLGARRVFKLRTGRVALQQLEDQVLGVRRLDDLPGAECPAAWYDYIRGRTDPMLRVLEHNLLDLLTLPSLVAVLAECAAGNGHATDLHCAGRVLARAGQEGRALDLQRLSARDTVDPALAARAHEEAARLLRRGGDPHEAAREALAAAEADPDLPGPWIALAKHAEHRTRDYRAALDYALRVESLLDRHAAPAWLRRDLARRIERLRGKSAGTDLP